MTDLPDNGKDKPFAVSATILGGSATALSVTVARVKVEYRL